MKKFASLFLALVMALGLLPFGVLAEAKPEESETDLCFSEPKYDQKTPGNIVLPTYTTGDTYPEYLKSKPLGDVVDPWNFYNRYCTSFAAWCLNDRNGVAFTNQYLGASAWGNAKTWGTVAQSLGVPVNNTPAVGAIAWWNTGTYGHVAWVSAVNGSSVTIEEYNFTVAGGFSTRTLSSPPTGYIHIQDITPPVINTNQAPTGYLGDCDGGAGYVHVTGWTYDPDSPSTSTWIKVYIGDECHDICANVPREDVNIICGVDGDHGFDSVIYTNKRGTQNVVVYGLDLNDDGDYIGECNAVLIDGERTVYISNITYTISYNANGGTGAPASQTKTENVNLTLSSTRPTRTGYTFLRWNTKADGTGTSYNPGGTYTANASATLYAQWQINTYTVTFKDHDGTVLKTQTVNYGASATPPADPTWEGHTFTGWSGSYTNVTSDRIVTATYDVNLYTIYYYIGADFYASQQVPYGSPITPLTVDIEGYTFLGWTMQYGDPLPEVMPAEDLYAFGTLIPTVVIITYVGDYNGTEEVSFGGNAALPVLDVEGLHYVFTVDGEPWDGTNVTGDVTVLVSIDIDVYTVTFVDPVTGEVLSVQQVEYALGAEAPEAPYHYGYTFGGWDLPFDFITADTVVTAVYTPVTFTVIFTDGMDNIISVQEVPYLSAAIEPEPPVREGWIFAGWDAEFDCIETSIVVNATWERQYLTVTFTGTYSGTELVEYGEDCPLPQYNSTSICYIFKVDGVEWCPENITEDVTVTVSVAPIRTTYHTVTFVGMNGEVISTQQVLHEQAAVAPEAPFVPGYRFVGWDRENFDCVTYTMTRTAIYEEYSAPAGVPGDLDGDGLVTFTDIASLYLFLIGVGNIDEALLPNADFNGDGSPTYADITDMYISLIS